MWPKWYMVGITGSFTNPQGYFQTFTIGTNTHAVDRSSSFSNLVTAISSQTSTISQKRKKKPIKKLNALSDNKGGCEECADQCPANTCSDEDSRLIKQFFKEVRYRELKSYYAKLITENRRWPTKSACRVCSQCGLDKDSPASKDIRHNIYCWGPETMCQG